MYIKYPILKDAERYAAGKREHLFGFFSFVSDTWCNADGFLCRVSIRERTNTDPESKYWGWKYADGHISMIFPSKLQLSVCFADSMEEVSAREGGRPVNLTVTILEVLSEKQDDHVRI